MNNTSSCKHVDSEGVIRYYFNNVLHRTDGPAFISSKCKKYYYNGKLHRDNDKPAVVWYSLDNNDYCMWYRYGKLHRIGKPAVMYLDQVEYWVNDIRCNIAQYKLNN